MRISEFYNSTNNYENDIFVLRDGITEFEGLGNYIKLKIKSSKQNSKLIKNNSVRCDICKNDTYRASYSRHLKSKNHLENIQQNNVNTPRKNPTKSEVKGVIKVTDTNIENQ